MALPHTEAFLHIVTASAHVPHSYMWSVSVRNASHPIVTFLAKLIVDSQVSDAFDLDAGLERQLFDCNACSSWHVVDHLDVYREE